MKLIKTLFTIIVGLFVVVAMVLGIFYYSFYTSTTDLYADIETLKRAGRLELYNRGYVQEMSQEDARYIYQSRCYRACHGEAAMITATLPPAGWIQIVERMRIKENVDINGREADLITKYLEHKYPTVRSAFSYEIRKAVHHAVWRTDSGQNDIYCDVIYVTPEYLQSIGARHLVEEYDLENHYVFITSFSVHDGEVELFDLDKIAALRADGREIRSTPHWILRFQTADKHHFEAVIRFAKEASPPIVKKDTKAFSLVLENVGGPEERAFTWDLPIAYPQEFLDQLKQQLS